MKIKIINPLIIIDLLVSVLVAVIFAFHSAVLQIILALPFILLLPGYALVKALFAKKQTMDASEVLALSAGTSIAVVGLTGFGLNYTSWGIKVEPVTIVIAAFTVACSIIALARQAIFEKKLHVLTEFHFNLPHWEGSPLNKAFSIVLSLLIVCALVVLGYTVNLHTNTERYTEFYILGHDGKAQDYPCVFIMQDNSVNSVLYGASNLSDNSGWGQVSLNVVSHEKQKQTYTIKMLLDGSAAQMMYDGSLVDQIVVNELSPGKTWEHAVGFSPKSLGDNQPVQFVLYKGGDPAPANSLQLSVNAAKTLLDFYLLGLNGQAGDVPLVLTVQNGELTGVQYSGGEFITTNGYANITLGIINHARQTSTFSIEIIMGGLPASILYNNQTTGQIKSISLASGATWQQEVGFTPPLGGENLKVDFLLFQDGGTTPVASLELVMSARFS